MVTGCTVMSVVIATTKERKDTGATMVRSSAVLSAFTNITRKIWRDRMGDRIGIQVVDIDGDSSDITIHSHWMGRELLALAQRFMNEMKDDAAFMRNDCYVGRIIARFVMWLGMNAEGNDVTIEDNEDDCEDNGIFIMNFEEMTVA